MEQDLWDMVAGCIQFQKIFKKQFILIENFLIIYIILKKFHRKNQQVMVILIGCFNNNIFSVMQHIIENN